MHRASIVLAFAAILPNLDTLASAKKVLELGLTRDIKGTPAPATGSKDSVDTDLTGITAQPAGVLFSVELTVGSDQQPVKVQVDTGSSDLWLPDVTSSICANPQNLCNAALKGDPLFFGGFDPSSSTTLQQQDDLGQFFITYADGTEIHGGFVADTVSISGEPVNDVIIAVANNGTSDFPINGIMGVGFTSGEAGVSQGLAREHLNFPASLKEQGLISTLAYSVYLNDAAAEKGSILFGGIDRAKFSGSLSTLPMLPDPRDGQTNFYVPWTSLTISTPSSNDTISTNIPALLDTGHSGLSIPSTLLNTITTALNIGPNDAPCALLDSDVTLHFNFGTEDAPDAASIAVRLADTVAPFLVNGTYATEDGAPACREPARATEESYATFGESFMRYAYAVFDLENEQISLAQARLNATGSDVVEIGAQGAGSVAAAGSGGNGTNGTNGTDGTDGTSGTTVTGASGPRPTAPTSTGAAAPGAQAPLRAVSLFAGAVMASSVLGGSFALLA